MTEKNESTGAPEDAIFTALYSGAEQTRLPHEPSYDVERGLQRFSAWLDDHTRTPAATTMQPRARRAPRKAAHHPVTSAPPSRRTGAMRKMAVYLGLVEDDHHYGGKHDSYEDYDSQDEYDAPGKRYESVAQPSGSAHITTLHPRTYNDARMIGEHFRDGISVVMNLTEMPDGDARRLVDFAAGLIFGLRGSIEHVADKVFLLSPVNEKAATEEDPGSQGAASSTRAGQGHA